MIKKLFFVYLVVLTVQWSLPVLAAKPAPESVPVPEKLNPPPTPSEPPKKQASPEDRMLTDREMTLAYIVLIFGLAALVLQCVLMWGARSDSQAVLKMSTVTLVIVGTLFVITAGFSSEQIAPAMGLFGTITGYLLGRETKQEKTGQP